ncbi:hydrogenase expression protein HypE, partial [Rhizobium ruizarguesonis]
HPHALRRERASRDLTGLEPQDRPDIRPWLDHGRWDLRHPLGKQAATLAEPEPYTFLRAEGDGLNQIPVGPVHAGII